MKKIISLLVILTMTLTLSAQSNYSPCYTNNMSKGNTAFNQGKYSEARTYYSNAKQCAGGNPTEAQKKIAACDAKIKAQRQAAEAKRKAEIQALAKTYTVNGVSFTMKYVEGGTFQMGATPEQGNDAYNDEKTVHSVTVSDFCMGETEVTQALWVAVMGSNPSSFKGDNLPVESVSWDDCQEFIRKLNVLTGKKFRMPTEAEWEYAARGGNRSNGYKYSGSNSISDVAWYGSGKDNTHPVKTKKANELGLYDMTGNVCEWCSDWYGSYNSSAQTNPTGPSSGSKRVSRGGSWNNAYARSCRTSSRFYGNPDRRISYGGFRLVVSHQ